MSAPSATAAPTSTAEPPKTNAAGKRICCVCKDTKKVRDECLFQFGEDKCQEPIELHKDFDSNRQRLKGEAGTGD